MPTRYIKQAKQNSVGAHSQEIVEIASNPLAMVDGGQLCPCHAGHTHRCGLACSRSGVPFPLGKLQSHIPTGGALNLPRKSACEKWKKLVVRTCRPGTSLIRFGAADSPS